MNFHIYIYLSNISPGNVEPELLHTYSRIDPYDTLILCVRVAVLTAVTLTVPIVLFPVSLLSIGYPSFSMNMISWCYFLFGSQRRVRKVPFLFTGT